MKPVLELHGAGAGALPKRPYMSRELHIRIHHLKKSSNLNRKKIIFASLNFEPNLLFLPRPQNRPSSLLRLTKPFK